MDSWCRMTGRLPKWSGGGERTLARACPSRAILELPSLLWQ